MIQITFGTRGRQDAVSLYILLDNFRVFIDFAQHARRQFSIFKGFIPHLSSKALEYLCFMLSKR
jgi:hypothetical protein